MLRSPGTASLRGCALSPGMSSTSSNPEDGDATEQSQLGLATVIQVSEVAALGGPWRAGLESTFP